MSWLTNLVNKDSHATTDVVKANAKNDLLVFVDSTRVCLLFIDRNQTPNKIVSWEESYLGPIENLNEGEPVRDLFGSLLKFFTTNKEKLDSVENVSVSISAEGVFFKNIEVPKLKPEDSQKLLLAEIKKSLPVDFSQILFAQNDLGSKHENMNSFFCVGIQKILFENYKNLFAKFSLNPYFEIEVFSLARIVNQDNTSRIILQVGRTNSFLIFLDGQIIQDVRLIELGQNEINKQIIKDTAISFKDAETLRSNVSTLKDNNRLGANILEEYHKDFDQKLAKAVILHVVEYEKKMNTEIKELVISGTVTSTKLKKIIQDEFDAEMKVEYVNEENFDEFVADNFALEDLKRFAQCFGLALRLK